MSKDKTSERSSQRSGRQQPQAGDLQALGPLGRPMTKDELVDGKENSESGTRRPRASGKQ
jgi:hypothetical protein